MSIRVGNTGDVVVQIQNQLNHVGGYKLAVDGIFGGGTKNAVVDFQRKKGLTADGVVGSNTWLSLIHI